MVLEGRITSLIRFILVQTKVFLKVVISRKFLIGFESSHFYNQIKTSSSGLFI